MEQDTSNIDQLQKFVDYAVGEGRSRHTIVAYRRDLTLFDRWFSISNGISFSPATVTPIDVRRYRSYLLTMQERKPATVNRRLANLSAFCAWARNTGLIAANPVDGIAQVAQPLGHESIDSTRIYTTPSEQDLQRDVEKVGSIYGW